MTALALFAQDILGTNTVVSGAPCTSTTVPSMSVLIGAGRIYQMSALEPTTWSSLAADTTTVLKQGILTSAGVTLACLAPTTTGFSINYLVEGQYQELDQNNVTLSYYNSSNPQQPFSGAGNNGIAQPTIRAGQFVVQTKAGVAATTGTQVTPTVDSGWVPMYIISVPFGATTLTVGNIAVSSLAPFIQGNQSGVLSLTGTGFSGTAPQCNCTYRVNGAIVSLGLTLLSGTSNATTFTLTGLPPNLQPASPALGLSNQFVPLALVQNNSAYINGAYAQIAASGVISLGITGSLTAWTASGTKSLIGNLNYLLY